MYPGSLHGFSLLYWVKFYTFLLGVVPGTRLFWTKQTVISAAFKLQCFCVFWAGVWLDSGFLEELATGQRSSTWSCCLITGAVLYLCPCVHRRHTHGCGITFSFKSSTTISFFQQDPKNLLGVPSAKSGRSLNTLPLLLKSRALGQGEVSPLTSVLSLLNP